MAHILKFDEIYKERIWGGRNLERVFGKTLPAGVKIGESWEVADLPDDKSVASVGRASGTKLDQLVRDWQSDLLGKAKLDCGEFPLLIKILDANDVLSVQVHPDYESADKMDDSVRAKYEAWYIIDAEEDACIYVGFKAGTTPEMVRAAIGDGSLESLLIKHPVKKGDFFYLPGGVVHAIGAGLVVAEIQTPSNTTFRLYDWNRVDAVTGEARELHVEQAIECIHFDAVVNGYYKDIADGKTFPAMADSQMAMMAQAPTFTIAKAVRSAGDCISVETGELIAWVILEGEGKISDSEVSFDLKAGQTVIIPAGAADVKAKFSSECTYLESRLTR